MRTLIVEDNPVDQQLLMDAARQLGLRADIVADGQEAIDQLRTADAGDYFDLVLVDFKLTNIDGLTASKFIKHELGLAHLPKIILVSAYKREDIITGPPSGSSVDAFLTKPVDRSGLAHTILDMVEQSATDDTPWPHPHRNDDQLLANSHILVAEDNAINRRVVVAMLEKRGVRVSIAEDGQETLDLVFKSPPGTFDAVLMDMDMPLVDGCQATETIKQDNAHGSLPIIALTAHNSNEVKERCFKAGMTRFLSKPIRPGFLYEAILGVLR